MQKCEETHWKEFSISGLRVLLAVTRLTVYREPHIWNIDTIVMKKMVSWCTYRDFKIQNMKNEYEDLEKHPQKYKNEEFILSIESVCRVL